MVNRTVHPGRGRASAAIVVAFALAVLSSCGGSPAGPEPVSVGELQDVLAGNTAIGEWLGEPYRQYFDADGSTIYVPAGARSSSGNWRVGQDDGVYESWWNERDGWERYEVSREGETFYWTGGGVELSPFTVVAGNQLRQPEG